MHQTKTVFFMILIAVFVVNCGEKKDDLKKDNILMKANEEISTMADSIFFVRIECMQIYKDCLYLSSYKTNKIYCLDNKFNLLRTIGKYGNGPKEFNGITQFEIMNDTIITYQDTGRKIKYFDLEGNYISEFQAPSSVTGMEFAVDNNLNLYLSTPRGEKYPITVLDKKGKTINGFGNWFIPKKKWQKYERNSRHLRIDSEGNLISVYNSEPIIEKYSPTGQLLSSINLRNNDFLKSRIGYIEKEYSQEKQNPLVGRVYSLFYWVKIKDNNLYLLCYDHGLNNILVVKNEKEGFAFKKNITIKNSDDDIPYIKKFVVKSPYEIIGFDAKKGSIITYGLTE